MSKMSPARKVKKGIKPEGTRNLNPMELLQLQEMIRLSNAERFKADQVKNNTALVPRGQEVGAELDAIARLMENAKNNYVAVKLQECGYPAGTKCDLNLNTGEIILAKDNGSESK